MAKDFDIFYSKKPKSRDRSHLLSTLKMDKPYKDNEILVSRGRTDSFADPEYVKGDLIRDQPSVKDLASIVDEDITSSNNYLNENEMLNLNARTLSKKGERSLNRLNLEQGLGTGK